MLFFGRQARECGRVCTEVSQEMVQHHNVEQLSKLRLKKLADLVTFGLYDGYEEFMADQKKLQQRRKRCREEGRMFLLWFAGASCLLLLLGFLADSRQMTVVLSLAALIALAYGLSTPILEMTIHKEIRYLGDVVLMAETRGVLGSIGQLYNDGQYVVAGVLLLFSIVFPLLKTLSMLVAGLFLQSRRMHGMVRFFKSLGKWSMADVFVVATFLVYLSAGKADVSRAALLPGFYFFLIYVILSILASLSAERMLKGLESA
jgi:hypothetical protein